MRDPEALTARQARFVAEYMVDHNATQAALRAGYSHAGATVRGSELLANRKVAAALAKAEEVLTAKTQVSAQNVLNELLILLNSDVRHFTIDDDGTLELAEGAPEEAWRAVSSVKHRTRTFEGKDGEVTTTHEVEFRLWDKTAAARMLGEHLALFKQRLAIGAGDTPVEFTLKVGGARERDDSE